MANYLGEITIFAGNFPPAGWMQCQGQLLNISDYSLLYSLLGTRYGGDGITTFGLPDLRSRVAVGAGQGSGLSAYTQGQTGGSETVSLQADNLPAHTHARPVANSLKMNCWSGEGNTDVPYNNFPAKITGKKMYVSAKNNPTININMPIKQSGYNSTSTGENWPIDLIQPVLGTNFIICINGDFPPPSTI
jgi:microcystin-dependent protein